MKRFFLLAVAIVLAVTTFSQNSDLDNAVYVRLGYGMPGGTLKSAVNITAGAQFEVGSIFYINALKLPEKLKLGIDATYLSFSGFEDMQMMKDSNETVSYFTAGAKVGPVVSYNFAKNCVADVYFKLHPHYFITGQKHADYIADNQFKLGTSFGLNVRWKFLMVGCELTSAKYDFTTTALPARKITSDQNVTFKLPVTNLSIGVNF